MSKHKKKYGKSEVEQNIMDINNLDVGKLAQMLSTIDIDKISDELSKLNIDENLIVEENKSSDEYENKDQKKKDKKRDKKDSKIDKKNNVKKTNNTSNLFQEDKTIKVLNALKPMVNAQRCEIIDKVIQIYSIGRILNK